MSELLAPGPDGGHRCRWCLATPRYLAYHDEEWGYPVADDRRLFEKLCLEGFQSGLSWRTILDKRERFRQVFHDFDIDRVACFDESDVRRLLQDAGIIRHRGKIEAAIHNARCAQAMIAQEGSLASYVWGFADDPAPAPSPVPVSTSPASIAMSRDLKKRGWKFVGPTTVYAFMQSMGLVNDHADGCVIRPRADRARRVFAAPRGGEPAIVTRSGNP
ncbi:MAG: DNA-3-methyladenine glycosylase I [Burkholderiaceae bacterium]